MVGGLLASSFVATMLAFAHWLSRSWASTALQPALVAGPPGGSLSSISSPSAAALASDSGLLTAKYSPTASRPDRCPSGVAPSRFQCASWTSAVAAESFVLRSNRASQRSISAHAGSAGWRVRNCRPVAISSLLRPVAWRPSSTFSIASWCRGCVVCIATKACPVRTSPNGRPFSWYRSISFSCSSAPSLLALLVLASCVSSAAACLPTASMSPSGTGVSLSAGLGGWWLARPTPRSARNKPANARERLNISCAE